MNLPQQLEDKKKELESLEYPDAMGNWEENQGEKHKICQAEIAILEQAIAEIKNIQSQQNPSQASEGVKMEASHNQHRTPKVVNVEEIQRDVNLTSTNLSADISNLLQKQRQEILDKIIEVKKEILLQRRYLPSKEYVGTMNYWVGDNNENRGIYVDLGGIIGKIDDFIEQLNQPKTEQ